MKRKFTVVLLALAATSLTSLAQDNPAPTPPPPSLPAPEPSTVPAPTTPPAEPALPTTPPPAPDKTTGPLPLPGVLTVQAREAAPLEAPAEGEAKAVAPATPEGTNAPANPNEVVPLIVIDDVPLTDAIRNLARQSSLNFQFDPRVAAGATTNSVNVSIRFENVTAQEALQAVLDNYNLILVQENKSKIARITIKDPKAEEPLITQIIQLKYSDPTNLVSLIKPGLSARSQVVADERTSQLIVSTTAKEMDNVLITVNKLDSATKQVLIEARLLETSKNPQSVKGIDWSGTLEAQNFKFGNNSGYQLPPTAPTPTAPGFAGTLNGILSDPKLLANTANGLNPATAFLNADGVSAVLSFLNKDADTEVVATPRAVTLDNQMATLSVTRAFPIFQVTPGSANSPAGATVTYTNLGTILHVTPRIAADKNISLKVVPEVSNIDSVDKQVLNGTVNTANIYAIRRLEANVMIPSGNTLVMGGMINDTKTKGFVKVPVLGDLPGIGLAFRKETTTRNKANLMIFITPTIVEDEDYHQTTAGREFLATRIVEKPEEKETAWNSGKPHDWTKPSR